MASSGKKRTTMAKLNRETRLRSKRAEKAARRAARKLTASDIAEAATDRDVLEASASGRDPGAPQGA